MPPMSIFLREQYKTLPVVPTPEDCAGKTYIITGANVGLGFECAKHFVRLSAARVILAVRSLSKGDEAKAKIEAETGRAGVVEVWHLDLTSYQSVREFAGKVKELDRVDVMIENAGIAMATGTPAEGLETMLTVNVVCTMLMAALVLPKLQECAKKFNTTPHLVIVGSETAFDNKGVLEKYDRDVDILEAVSQDTKLGIGRYPVSKLLLFYSYRQFASLHPASETGVVVNYLNPGLCVTELSRNGPVLMRAAVKVLRFIIMRTAEVGSRTELHAAVAGKESHGKYVSACEIKDFNVPEWASNDVGKAMGQRVWKSVAKRLNEAQQGCV